MERAFQRPGTRPVPPEFQSLAKRLMDELGARGAAARLGVSRTALVNLAAGGTVVPGTLSLLREALQRQGIPVPVAAMASSLVSELDRVGGRTL